MRQKKSLNVIIVQYFSILLFIVVGAAASSFYYGSTRIVLEFSDNVTKQLTEKIIQRTINFLNVPASQSQVISQLVTDDNIINNHQQLWKYMWEQLQVLPQVQAIFVADKKGSYVQVRREPKHATRYIDRSSGKPFEQWYYRDLDYNIIGEKSKIPTFDPRIRPWYKNTGAESKIYWTDVYMFTTAQTPGISATFPVLNKNNEVTAVVCVNSPLHSLSDFLSKQHVSENGVVFITNSKNEIMAFPDKSFLTSALPTSELRRLAVIYELPQKWIKAAYEHHKVTAETRYTTKTDGVKYVTNVVPFPKSFNSQWEIFVIIPEMDILGSINDVLIKTIVIIFIIIFISMLLVRLFSRRITRPIELLADEAEKMKQFNLDQMVPVESNIKEIADMSKAVELAAMGLQSFKKYVPADLVRQLIQLGEKAEVGGKEVELTIFFSDIADFTTLSENMHPEDLMQHLSAYLQALTNVVMDQQGTIDKYIGDAIMAFWGAPMPIDNCPILACTAALQCIRANQVLNKDWLKRRKPELYTRIGLHTGRTIVGNLGSDERINYTIIGDSVNLASRLEGLNKLYGTQIIISEDTYRLVSDRFFCRLLDIVAVKGKVKGVKIFELVAEMGAELPKTETYYEWYEKAFQAYLNKEWQKALFILLNIFKDDANDVVVKLLIGRCNNFMKKPELIPLNWDGVTIMARK